MQEEAKSKAFDRFFILISCLCVFAFLCVSSAFGFSHTKGDVGPPILFPRFPPRPPSFFISLREIGLFLCLGASLVSLLYPRLSTWLRLSLRRKAFLVVLLGTSLFLPFFFIPHNYKPFALGVMFLPSSIGLSGFFSAIGERIARFFKLQNQSEIFLLVLGMMPFLFMLLLFKGFYLRALFGLLMIYGLGSVVSILI